MRPHFILLAFFTLIYSHSTLFAQERVPYTVYIKPGSVLKRLSDQKSFITNKGLYTKVLEIHPTKRDLFNVYDNEGNLVYTTGPDNIVEIAEDVRVYPKVNAALVYPPKATMFSEDQSSKFNTQINLYLETLNVDGLNQIYSPLNSKANGNRIELKTLYTSSFPIDFGLSLSLQNAKWDAEINGNAQEITLTSFSIGPTFNYKFYTHEYFHLNANLSAELSPLFETKSQISKESYSAFNYGLGINAIFPTMFGSFNLGLSYKHSNLNLSKTTLDSSTGFRETALSLNSVGFLLGYVKDWEL